jgi:hypothetical protein
MQPTGTLPALSDSLDAEESCRLRREWLAAELRLTQAMPWAQEDDDSVWRPLRRCEAKRAAGLLAEARLSSAAYFAAVRLEPRVRPR